MRASRSFARSRVSPVELRCGNTTSYKEQAVCFWCGEGFGAGPDKKTREHLVPASQGGSDADINIVAAHQRCNAGRACSLSWVPFHIHGQVGKRIMKRNWSGAAS